MKPQQLFLMLTTQSGLTAYAVAKARKEGGFALTMTAALLEKQIGRQVRRERARGREQEDNEMVMRLVNGNAICAV